VLGWSAHLLAHARASSVLPDVLVQVIRDLLDVHKFVIVVEHDLSVLDYLSDFICCLYGKPGAYGVVTLPFGVR
jgi:translation initiation factor RLI1